MVKTKTKKIGRFFIACLLMLTSCSTPSQHFAEAAMASGFIGFSVNTGRFDHQFYVSPGTNHPNGDSTLHVYLDGDGSPWERQRWISDDPTSRNPMILELMRQDNNPAVFVGRPCYHGFSKSAACHYRYWTSHRYSNEVVNSMVLAFKQWLSQHPYRRIVLIGFSGGGTLAVLMAPKIAGLETVVTIAANLDTEAWSRYHHYPPLPESLNPAKLVARGHWRQIHLAGLEDTVVPAALIKAYADKQVSARYIAYPHFDHHCCWIKEWPAILPLF